MGWILALCTSALAAAHDVYYSRERMKKHSSLLKSWYIALFGTFAFVLVVMVTGVPRITTAFWIYVAIQVALLSVAQVLYMRALSLGPVSQTQPILGLTVLLLAVTNPLMTNDRVTFLGWVGVFMVGVGIYATQHPGKNERGESQGFFSPFVEMWRQPGVGSKLAVAVIYSITANIDQLGVRASNGPFFALTVYIGMLIVQSLWLLWIRISARSKAEPPEQKEARFDPQILLGAWLNAASVLTHLAALAFLTVPYVIAIKRTSILSVSLWGYIVRKERALHWYRLLGVSLVVLGVATILILGKTSGP